MCQSLSLRWGHGKVSVVRNKRVSFIDEMKVFRYKEFKHALFLYDSIVSFNK